MSRAPGQWALVLGASCGTGAAVARALAKDPGFHVFGAHRGNYPEEAASVERDVAALGRSMHMRKADAGTLEGAQAGADELLEVAGPRSVKMVVHSLANASVGRLVGTKATQLAPRQIQKTFDSMAHSFVYWTQELVARDLLAPGAHILGLSNWMEDSVMRGAPLIAATKATLTIYVRHLAHDLGPRGYRVNLLKFGGVFTPAVEKTFGAERLERLQGVLRRVSASRSISTVEEVGRFVSILAGNAATRFNGATIDFTGGESLALFDALMHFEEETP
jgi:NAD(P)-dependent dehydrogenase (short-subunit alcohol dehydrogenase family)